MMEEGAADGGCDRIRTAGMVYCTLRTRARKKRGRKGGVPMPLWMKKVTASWQLKLILDFWSSCFYP